MKVLYPLTDIRQFINETYNDEELEVLCFDEFSEVYRNFTTGQTKTQKILRLLDYCDSRDRIPNLLSHLKEGRPEQYKVRFPQFAEPLPQRDDLGNRVMPAENEATATELQSPGLQAIASPDGQYIIAKPPPDWLVSTLTLEELAQVNLQVPETVAKQLAGIEQAREIYRFASREQVSVLPVPSRTLVEGRKTLGVREEIRAAASLVIAPLDRAQPPFYVERTLTHNFLQSLGIELIVSSLKSLSASIVKTTGRQKLVAEFGQTITDAVINDVEGQSITLNMTHIGIEGDMRDYILVMSYVSSSSVYSAQLHRTVQTLESLVNSFRPLAVGDPERKRQELEARAASGYQYYVATSGPALFTTELESALTLMRDVNLEDPALRGRVIRQIINFEALAKEIGLSNDFLDELWTVTSKAKVGDAQEFKELLGRLIAQVTQSPNTQG
jgi:hypothetical protein